MTKISLQEYLKQLQIKPRKNPEVPKDRLQNSPIFLRRIIERAPSERAWSGESECHATVSTGGISHLVLYASVELVVQRNLRQAVTGNNHMYD